LLSVCIGQTIVGLDQRAITVALPTLTTTFHTAFTTIQWTILVYDLVLIGLIITMGRLGDLYGRRRFYSIGFIIFVTASAICGLSQTTGQLIFFRAVQALGGSMIAANGRAIVSVNLPREERGRALGLTSTAFHIGFLTGPSLGGFLIDTIGWRWIFYINLPFSLCGAYLAWKVVPETRSKEKIGIDIPGAVLLLLTNALFIYAIDQLPRVGWRHPTFFLSLILSLVGLIFLLRTESRAGTPILNLSMFRSRLFSAGIASLFLVSGTLSAINFLMPFFLQNLLGYSPSQVGWIIVADSVIIMIMPPVAGSWSDRLGSRLLCTIGCAVIVVAQFFPGNIGDSCVAYPNHFSPGTLGRRLGAVQRTQSKFHFGRSQSGNDRCCRRDDRHHGTGGWCDGSRAVRDPIWLPSFRRRVEQQPNRLFGKLARCAGRFYEIIFEDDLRPKLFHFAGGIIFRDSR
jgi:EmrB/QacA subfamily drug resistance transporter